MREHSTAFERVTDDDAVEVEVFYTISDYDPGVLSGPPEDCYPPEGGEVEIQRVMLDGKEIQITDDEAEKWADQIAQTHDFDDYYGGYDD